MYNKNGKRVYVKILAYNESKKELSYRITHSGGYFDGVMAVPLEVYQQKSTELIKREFDELDKYILNRIAKEVTI